MYLVHRRAFRRSKCYNSTTYTFSEPEPLCWPIRVHCVYAHLISSLWYQGIARMTSQWRINQFSVALQRACVLIGEYISCYFHNKMTVRHFYKQWIPQSLVTQYKDNQERQFVRKRIHDITIKYIYLEECYCLKELSNHRPLSIKARRARMNCPTRFLITWRNNNLQFHRTLA